MAVKMYSRSKDGNVQLAKNFKLCEFACNDGTDKVLVDDVLVKVLQYIRDTLGKPVRLNSAYRTPEYNKKIGGAANSQHMHGTAADISVTGVTPLEVCKIAETALKAAGVTVGGIGQYPTFTHVDVRGSNRWRCNMATGKNVTGFS